MSITLPPPTDAPSSRNEDDEYGDEFDDEFEDALRLELARAGLIDDE